jgi:Ca-activated chloride channel family protein
LSPTSGADKEKIITAIDELTPGGTTPGESGINLAYSLAKRHFIKGGNNRVILATDGDFNVGQTSEKALDELITKERQSGIFLTCLGVGMGNFKDSKLETLAKRGNGNYAYLDDIKEAEKVLVKEVTQTFYSVADDVLLNVHFNPDIINQYRLIGFDNKKDAISDTTKDLEGGEIGSGNSVMAIFEVMWQDTISVNALPALDRTLASVSLSYSVHNHSKIRHEVKFDCTNNYKEFTNLDKDYQLAASLAMFGMKLRQSKYIKKADWSDIESIALKAYDPSDYLQSEFIRLISLAKKIYGKSKKYKGN